MWQKPPELLGKTEEEEDEGPFDTPEQKLEGFRKLLEKKGVNSKSAALARFLRGVEHTGVHADRN